MNRSSRNSNPMSQLPQTDQRRRAHMPLLRPPNTRLALEKQPTDPRMGIRGQTDPNRHLYEYRDVPSELAAPPAADRRRFQSPQALFSRSKQPRRLGCHRYVVDELWQWMVDTAIGQLSARVDSAYLLQYDGTLSNRSAHCANLRRLPLFRYLYAERHIGILDLLFCRHTAHYRRIGSPVRTHRRRPLLRQEPGGAFSARRFTSRLEDGRCLSSCSASWCRASITGPTSAAWLPVRCSACCCPIMNARAKDPCSPDDRRRLHGSHRTGC